MSHLFLKVNVQPGRLGVEGRTLGGCRGASRGQEDSLPCSHGGPRRDGPWGGRPGWTLSWGLGAALGSGSYCPEDAGLRATQGPGALPSGPPQAKSLPGRLRSPAVEVRGLLPVELTVGRAAVLGGTEALEAVIDELGVLLMEVLVGHHV